jgi:hypothetical protein
MGNKIDISREHLCVNPFSNGMPGHLAEPPDRTGFEQGVDVHHVLERRLGSDFAMGWHVFYGKYTK